MALVAVTYLYGSPRPNVRSSATISVQGTTESAIVAELNRLYPTHKNKTLIKIEIKRP